MKSIKKVLKIANVMTCSTCLSLVTASTFFSFNNSLIKSDNSIIKTFNTKKIDSKYHLPIYEVKDLICAPNYNDYQEIYGYNNLSSLDSYGWATIDGNNSFKQVFMNDDVATFFASKCSKNSSDPFANADLATISSNIGTSLSLKGLYANDEYRDIAIQALNNPHLATIFSSITTLDLSHNNLWFMPLIGLGQNYDLPESTNITKDNAWGLKNVNYLDLSFNQMTVVPFYKNTNLGALASSLDGIDYSAYVGSSLADGNIIINLNNNNIDTGQIDNNLSVGDRRFNKWNGQATDNLKFYQFTSDDPTNSYYDAKGLLWQNTTIWTSDLSLFKTYLQDQVASRWALGQLPASK